MLEIIREITLDVSEENRFAAITAKQYDSRSRYLLVRLTDRGEALTLPDTASVLISATRPDGLSDGFEGHVQDGAALVPLDYWMLMQDGTVTCELVVTGADGYRLTTMSFALDVRHSCFGDGPTPGGNHGVYVRLLEEIEELKKKIGEGLGGNGTVTDEQISAAVEKYLTEHPIESPEVEKAAESARKSAEEAGVSASNAAQSAENAETFATAAGTAHEGAVNAKQDAESAKREAEQAATNASSSAGTAGESATTAQNAAQSAVSAKEAAETAKTAAEGARDEAGQQATTAANAAQRASTAAENAEKAQASAEGARDTAITNAEMASTSATVAAREAGNASKSSAAAATDRTAAETAANAAADAKSAAETARDQAKQSETNPANSAGTASTTAANATSAKTAAETAKSEAQTAATNAGKSATAASESAANAEVSEEAAATSESNAAKSATAAAGSATTATNAATAAQTAQGKAETAQAAAESAKSTASQKATDATNAAQTAAGKATEASESATAAGTAKTAAEEAAARAEEAANRLLGMAVVGEIETADGQTNIILSGDLVPGTYTFAYLVRKADGTTETVTIGTYTVEDESETKTYTVTFVADGVTVAEVEYEEGATYLDPDDIPAVPAKSGYTGEWEAYTLNNTNITVNAEYTEIVVEPGYTNLANPSDDYWKEGYRLSIQGGGTTPHDGMTSTNFIPAKKGDTLFVMGLDITKNVNGQQSKIVKYTAADESKVSGGAFGTTSNVADQYGSKLVKSGDVQSLVLLECNDGKNTMTDNIKYIRLDGELMDGYTSSDVIITINEPIPIE